MQANLEPTHTFFIKTIRIYGYVPYLHTKYYFLILDVPAVIQTKFIIMKLALKRRQLINQLSPSQMPNRHLKNWANVMSIFVTDVHLNTESAMLNVAANQETNGPRVTINVQCAHSEHHHSGMISVNWKSSILTQAKVYGFWKFFCGYFHFKELKILRMSAFTFFLKALNIQYNEKHDFCFKKMLISVYFLASKSAFFTKNPV